MTLSERATAERRAWELLTTDFQWSPPDDLGVRVYGDSGSGDAVRLQLFEVAITAVFARLRPDYDWFVTPNRPDGGLDFVGEQRFLDDRTLGIAAAITVGGQCKKRSSVGDIVGEVAGSLARMATTINPTFFVVALSARLAHERVEDARAILERVHQRHCHILDRDQIEGLFHDHMPVVDRILGQALEVEQADQVRSYLHTYGQDRREVGIQVSAPSHVLAGVPFTVPVTVRSSLASAPDLRLWWEDSYESGDSPVALISPAGCETPSGAAYAASRSTDDPVHFVETLEFISHAVGRRDLGSIRIGTSGTRGADVALGEVRVVENVRPRFFEGPFAGALITLREQYARALAQGGASVAVVGPGGSGKSRLCEEFALERRRRGCETVFARAAKTRNEPHRLLAELFVGLVPEPLGLGDPAQHVLAGIRRYDRELAERAEPAIETIFGLRSDAVADVRDQVVISALLLLAAARARGAPLILHLQDLHWCSRDVLLMLERLAWQIGRAVARMATGARDPESGVLFVFEGRPREQLEQDPEAWTSQPFETFVQKLDVPVVRCSSFTREDGLEFVRRLFEARNSPRRRVTAEMLTVQREVIEQIDRTSGGNPFHSLEQVQILKELRVLGQNPETGFLYLIQPPPGQLPLPESVFASIEARWRYLRDRSPALSLLLWACALVEDRVPMPLFRCLWRELAPGVSLAEVDGTDVLWTGAGEAPVVTFRHENYFRAIRRFELSQDERTRTIAAYSAWFEGRPLEPADQFRWARALLALPDAARSSALLERAAVEARRAGDAGMAQRITAAWLDLVWNQDEVAPLPADEFVRYCDAELTLTADLLAADRQQASDRLARLRERFVGPARKRLHPHRLRAEVIRSQLLFNDRRPALAAEVAEHVVEELDRLRDADRPPETEILEMEAQHSLAVALALSGEGERALEMSERAVAIARRHPGQQADEVVGTYANILLGEDPAASEILLRELLVTMTAPSGARDAARINLAMALVLRSQEIGDHRLEMLGEAAGLLDDVYGRSFQLGHFSAAAAAALMRGIVSALRDEGDEVGWFSQAVAGAARARQMETLWRGHINLATAMYAAGEPVHGSVRDHAHAALDILLDTLRPDPHPDRSARYALVQRPLAQAVRFLLLAGDDAGPAALESLPGLRDAFADPRAGLLADDLGGTHEWVLAGDHGYVIY